MGAKKKVDEKLYNKVKKELKVPKDDAKVMAKYGLGQAIVRAIRKSWCYDDYISRTTKNDVKIKKPRKQLSVQEKTFLAWYALIAIACLAGLIVLALIVRWIISWFGV